MKKNSEIEKATKFVAYYTGLAAGTGAVPVPASSAAIVAQNGAMLAHISSALGTPIDISVVIKSIGFMGGVNMIGRNFFIEGAKLLSWGTGSFWAAVALSALGASTAGIQTYIIGLIAIEIGKNGGRSLDTVMAKKITKEAKNNYSSFLKEWQSKKPPKPEPA
jgi:uncharacterized protein (DUF697 family)